MIILSFVSRPHPDFVISGTRIYGRIYPSKVAAPLISAGPNKVAFLITHYTTPPSQPEPVTADSTHISPSLKTRLHNQEPLRVYLSATQVLSWDDEPTALHVQRLTELANSEPNPQRNFSSDSCCLL